MAIINPQSYPIGLDISDTVIRAVQFRSGSLLGRSKKILNIFWGEVLVPKDTIVNGVIQNLEKIAELIKELIKKNKFVNKNVLSVLPETVTFIKLIEINPGEDKKEGINLEKLIIEEIKNHIPFSQNELYLDWQIIDEDVDDKLQILIGAAPKQIVLDYQTLLTKAGLLPLALEIEAVSLSRTLMDQAAKNPCTMIIDMGANRTSLILYDNDVIQFSISLPVSGDNLTKTIGAKLKMPFDKAEDLKISCSLDESKCPPNLYDVISEPTELIIDKIRAAGMYYKGHFTDFHPISQIILTGGGANFLDLDKILEDKLKVKVIKGSIWTNFDIKQKQRPLSQDKTMSYATAIGLALRGLTEEKI